jgi:acetone carboxylase gamma subunit
MNEITPKSEYISQIKAAEYLHANVITKIAYKNHKLNNTIENIDKIIKNKKHKYIYLKYKEILQIRDTFYDKILSEIADNMYLHAKAKIIQKQFRLANTNPDYIICQHRLLHEFYALI